MFNAKRTALYVALGMMTFATGEATAGCKYIPNPPGSLVCAAWIKGSEICDVTSGGDSPMTSVTCSITGATFIDGAEGASGTNGAYCASGNPPPGLCETSSGSFTTGSPNASPGKVNGNGKKPPKQTQCHENHGGKHNAQGHEDCSINGAGNGYLSATDADPDCSQTGDVYTCTASAEIGAPPGSTCPNGQPATDFTASAMLAITEVCVDDGGSGGGGIVCDKIYEFCTVDPTLPDGTPYACVDISEQGETCNADGGFATFAPDDPMCGARRTCID